METLNNKSTTIFCQLIEKMIGKDYLKIVLDPYMPLVLERTAEAVKTIYGEATLYSLCHYYKQNGDVMVDPEMEFIFLDGLSVNTYQTEKVKVIPYSFIQGPLNIHQESIWIRGENMLAYITSLQHEHAVFANQWLDTIQSQGFLGDKAKNSF
jgi:hypothetical protein